jgi:hypothetical protein
MKGRPSQRVWESPDYQYLALPGPYNNSFCAFRQKTREIIPYLKGV